MYGGLLREEVPEAVGEGDPVNMAQSGTLTTTKGGRAGTLELEIGLTTNRKGWIEKREELVGWRQRNAMLELKEEEKGKF